MSNVKQQPRKQLGMGSSHSRTLSRGPTAGTAQPDLHHPTPNRAQAGVPNTFLPPRSAVPPAPGTARSSPTTSDNTAVNPRSPEPKPLPLGGWVKANQAPDPISRPQTRADNRSKPAQDVLAEHLSNELRRSKTPAPARSGTMIPRIQDPSTVNLPVPRQDSDFGRIHAPSGLAQDTETVSKPSEVVPSPARLIVGGTTPFVPPPPAFDWVRKGKKAAVEAEPSPPPTGSPTNPPSVDRARTSIPTTGSSMTKHSVPAPDVPKQPQALNNRTQSNERFGQIPRPVVNDRAQGDEHRQKPHPPANRLREQDIARNSPRLMTNDRTRINEPRAGNSPTMRHPLRHIEDPDETLLNIQTPGENMEPGSDKFDGNVAMQRRVADLRELAKSGVKRRFSPSLPSHPLPPPVSSNIATGTSHKSRVPMEEVDEDDNSYYGEERYESAKRAKSIARQEPPAMEEDYSQEPRYASYGPDYATPYESHPHYPMPDSNPPSQEQVTQNFNYDREQYDEQPRYYDDEVAPLSQPQSDRTEYQSQSPVAQAKNKYDTEAYMRANVDKYERLAQKWRECSQAEWVEGADVLMKQFDDVLTFVKDHMTEKIQLFTKLHSDLDGHEKMLDERDSKLRQEEQHLASGAQGVIGSRSNPIKV